MRCAWKEFLAVLPLWMRADVDRLGSTSMLELRLRLNFPPELVFSANSLWLDRIITQDDLHYTFNTASQYSPWTAASAAHGYITIMGGHRIGLCGETVIQQGKVTGIRRITSLCVRIARDISGIATEISRYSGSILILGPPGWGKTTMLRDLVRQTGMKEHVCVVDERNELFPDGFHRGKRMDVLSGCPKCEGIPMLLRTMGPRCIAVDEITDRDDAASLLQAANCGVRFLATAHAISVSDFRQRNVYKPLMENEIFDVFVVLKQDKSYTVERMTECSANGSALY